MDASKSCPPLTKRQLAVLVFMVESFHKNDQLPRNRDIAEAFNYSSNNSAVDHIKALERKGYLIRNQMNRLQFSREKPFSGLYDEIGLIACKPDGSCCPMGWLAGLMHRDKKESLMDELLGDHLMWREPRVVKSE